MEISAVNEYPLEQTWLTEGCSWPSSGSGVVFPTCMKAIKRLQPPPRPAGLDRTPQPARDRWAADDFKYPPINIRINMLSGVEIPGDLLILLNVNCCTATVGVIPACACLQVTSRRMCRPMRTLGVAWLGTASPSTPVQSLPGAPAPLFSQV